MKFIWMVEHKQDASGTVRKIWTKVGVGVKQPDGSYNLSLMIVPMSGHLVMKAEEDPNPPAQEDASGTLTVHDYHSLTIQDNLPNPCLLN